MLSQPTQIVKNVILLVVLLCVLTFCTACSAPAEVGPSVDSASRQPAHDAAISEAQPVEDELVSSVFNSSSAKTQYTLGEAFDETGLSLTLQYRSGKTDTVTSGFSSDLDTASPGEKDVHIQYQGENVGLLHVTVLRDAILEACDAGTGYDDDVRLISYGGKLYGIGTEYSGNALGDFFIYRKDSLSAAPSASSIPSTFPAFSFCVTVSSFRLSQTMIIPSLLPPT